MFEFLDEAEGRTREENVAITKAMLEALPSKICWIRASEVHLKSANAPAGNWDLILISDFDSFDDLERYRVHPDHVAVGTFMRPVRRARACVDFEF
jgi:hypothetical protein